MGGAKMQTEELRIGNYILILKEIVKVERIIIGQSSGMAIINRKPYDMIVPIPLTEQWLIDFGFINGIMELTLEVEGQRLRKIEVHCFDFTNLTDYKEKIFCKLTYSSWNPKTQTRELFERKFYYVHQFQNLCFALTGNELIKK